MEKFNNWLLKNIFSIAFIYGISGILFETVYLYDLDLGEVMKWVYLFFDFGHINFDFFRADAFKLEFYIDDSSYRLVGYLDLAFYILLILGAIVYKLSKGKEIKVLKFCFSLMFLFAILSFLFQFYFILTESESRNVFSIAFLLKTILMFYISYLYLITWKSERTYSDTNTTYLTNFKEFTLKPAKRQQRVIHYILDLFLILGIFSKYVFDFYFGALIEYLEFFVGERFAATIVFFVFSSFYYMIFEGFFKSTPAKYLTQTSVVSLHNQKVTFTNILGRTLCRRIPFEAFSFFGKIGWHDSLAYTTVAKQKREPSKYKVVYIVFLLLLITLFVYRFIEESRIF